MVSDITKGANPPSGSAYVLIPRAKPELCPGQVEQRDLRVLLHSFEDGFTSVWGNVESANIKLGREVGQLPLPPAS